MTKKTVMIATELLAQLTFKVRMCRFSHFKFEKTKFYLFVDVIEGGYYDDCDDCDDGYEVVDDCYDCDDGYEVIQDDCDDCVEVVDDDCDDCVEVIDDDCADCVEVADDCDDCY